MKSIRAGRGLGDAIYLQSIVRHLVERGADLEVCCDWPLLFDCFPVRMAEFRRLTIDIVAHYTTRKTNAETDQFEDCCISAGIREPVDLRLGWAPRSRPLANIGKPVVAVSLPRPPFGRADGYGMELLPKFETIQRAIDMIEDRAYLVQVGDGKPAFAFRGINLDLAGKTSVADLLDVACRADGFLGYCSFFVPLAESLCRPGLIVWSRRGVRSADRYIRTITPEKILHRPSSLALMDDASDSEISEAVDAFLGAAGSR